MRAVLLIGLLLAALPSVGGFLAAGPPARTGVPASAPAPAPVGDDTDDDDDDESSGDDD